MLTILTVYEIMTLQKNTISSLGHSVPKRCQPSAASTTSSTLRVDVIVTRCYTARHRPICRRISMLFRQQTRHATTRNSITNMTEVPCYHTTIVTTTLVLDESIGIYPTVEGCGLQGPFYQNFSFFVTPVYDGLNSICLALRYDEHLEFRFLEGAVQFITVPIDRPSDTQEDQTGVRQQS